MAELSERDLQEITALHDEWIGKELAGNSSHLIDLCAEGIQWIPPEARPLRGKEAIAQYLEANTVELQQIDVDDLLVAGSDTTAYLTGNYRTRFFSEGHSEIHEATGTHLWVLRKIDNKWRVVVVAWSSW